MCIKSGFVQIITDTGDSYVQSWNVSNRHIEI